MRVIFVFYCLDSEHNGGSWLDSNRNRRESVVGLIPFPRVGRSGIESDLRDMDSLCT